MTKKNRRKNTSIKKGHKTAHSSAKPKKKPIGMIILAVVIILLMLLMTINPDTFRKKEKIVARKSEPQFVKEGELSFFRSSDSSDIHLIDIEIAENNFERMRGMMHRKSMDENTGMFFIMDYEEIQSFWMKNTYVSLDILYLDSDFRIVKIYPFTQPLSNTSLPSIKKAKYVLELKAGSTDRLGIKEGDFISYSRIDEQNM